MRHFIRAAWICLAVGFGVASLSSPSAAYVPVADHLLALVASRLDDPAPSVVRQVRTLPAPEPGQAARQFREIVYIRFPGAFRSELTTDDGRRVVVERSGLRWTSKTEGIAEPTPEPMDLAIRLLVHNRPEGLARVLAAAGIDLTVTSLGRFEGRLGFVLGARYPDESVPQVWFDRETLLPFRWLMLNPTAEGPPQRTEIRYFAWQKTGDLRYPQVMACYQDERLVSEARVEGIQSPAEVPDTLFSPDRPTAPPASDSKLPGP
jgi:hypothetical protein